MTIHKSKGLEFPICYFAGFTSNFNISELKEKIIQENEEANQKYVETFFEEKYIKDLEKIKERENGNKK